MTQAVLAIQPAAPALPNGPNASEAGEPTMEELAASLPEPSPETREEDAAAAKALLEPAEPAAEEPADPTATTEPAPAAPVEPPADEALERAQKAAAKAREGSRRYAETQRMLAEQSARVQAAAREAAMLRERQAQYEAREATLKADPYKALKDLGMTDADLATRALRENTPEAVTHRLEQALEQERNARVALEQRLAAQQQAAVAERAQSEFIATATNAEDYPELAVRRPAVQLAAARAALAQIAANGHPTSHLTTEQIAEAAELWLAPTTPKAKPKAAEPVKAAPAAAKPSGVTLTNKQAQTRAVAPAAWDSLSDEQQLAHLAAQLEPLG